MLTRAAWNCLNGRACQASKARRGATRRDAARRAYGRGRRPAVAVIIIIITISIIIRVFCRYCCHSSCLRKGLLYFGCYHLAENLEGALAELRGLGVRLYAAEDRMYVTELAE